MVYVPIGSDEELGRNIRQLCGQLRFVNKDEVQAYQFIKIEGRPYKIYVRAIDESEYVRE